MFFGPFWHPIFSPPPTSGPGGVPLPERITVPLWINDLPLQRTGMVLVRAANWLDNLTRPLPDTARLPGLTSGRVVDVMPSAALDLEIVGALVQVPYRTLQSQLARVHDWLLGELELRWAHAPDFVKRGMAGEARVESYTPEAAFASAVGSWRVTVPIRCADSVSYARQPRRLRLSTTPVPVEVRGVAVGGTVLLEGPLSGTVHLDLISPSGVRLERLTLVIPTEEALGSGDVCTIRLDAPHTIEKRTALGVITNVYHWRSLTSSTGWWQIPPRHADRWTGQYPALRLSTGQGWLTYVLGEAA